MASVADITWLKSVEPKPLEYRTHQARVKFGDWKQGDHPALRTTTFDIESFCVGPHNITSRVTGFEMVAKAGRAVECRFTVFAFCPLEGDVLNYCELVEGAE